MRKPHGRVALATATLLGLLSVLGTSPALAARPGLSGGGVKGSPQPELKPFRLGPASTGGSVAIEPDGSLVVAYGIKSGHGKTAVCVLARGGHRCTGGAVTLSPLSGDDEFPATYAFVPSANHVAVIENDCCDSSSAGGDLLFTSTDGGHTFGAPVRIGSLGMAAAALVGQHIVFTEGDTSSTQIESVPVNASGPPASVATPITGDAVDVGVANFRGGVLAASDNDGSPDTVRVAYARSGTNFDATSSYHQVGTFRGESLVAVSGGALLTEQASGRNALELRLFNGHSFGPARTVPDTAGGGPEWFALNQDPGGTVHVFNDSTHLARTYGLYEQTTTTGASWDSPVDLGDAVGSTGFAVALDRSGSGLVLGTPGQATGFPVLARQDITFTLSKSTVHKGRTVTGSGQVRPKAPGRVIELQAERSGLWYTVGTARESASGTFKFTIRGNGTGSHQFRAVASDLAGYVMYGYSAARTLRVTS
ncbi:MAG TPA: hypothetical protein VHU92_24335 [Streptosporangiaceae bacterium]|nr:hypothetical protein [Streptosporangiaceae bacterium]